MQGSFSIHPGETRTTRIPFGVTSLEKALAASRKRRLRCGPVVDAGSGSSRWIEVTWMTTPEPCSIIIGNRADQAGFIGFARG
ncbi:hypothetical protein X772_29360 [Mesorhizobium sp. LSJC280B00]|nr:hypothetical protein X772_29360 [Mesorhizobium sp. LSJC280B00]